MECVPSVVLWALLTLLGLVYMVRLYHIEIKVCGITCKRKMCYTGDVLANAGSGLLDPSEIDDCFLRIGRHISCMVLYLYAESFLLCRTSGKEYR